MALPGVQVLFAFLLVVPFSNGWDRVTGFQRDVFFAAFLCTTVASVLLIAPSAIHRLLWRARDKEHILVTSNRLAIAGMAFLAAGMGAVVLLIADILFGTDWAAATAAAVAAVFGWFWYGVPLLRRAVRGDR